MIKEEIDVSNNSWGRTGGYSYFREAENNAVLAGVSVIASQGNNGSPGPNLPIPCGSTSSPENVVGVGATMDYATFSKAIISDAPDMDSIGKEYKGIWGSTGNDFNDFGRPIQVVDCGWGRESDFSGLDVEGKIALIARGPGGQDGDTFGPPLPYSIKGSRAKTSGAIAMIIYNHSPGFIRSFYLSVPASQLVPSLEMIRTQGLDIREMLHAGNDWKLGEVDKNQNDVFMKLTKPQGYANITDFTSQGPTAIASLKPDVCAPGDQIRTSAPRWQWEALKGKYTNSFGGTSAAGPFVCGVACLVRQARPEWNPFEVKRAMMNTANLLRRYKDDKYIPVLSQGMGRADAFNACMTDVLIQPPSSLIVAGNGYIKTDDSPGEWEDKAKKARLPNEIKKSMIAYKVYNYSTTNPHNIELSYEVNSRQADDIKVIFSSKSISIPIASEIDDPSSAWVGIDVEWPVRLTGGTNDIIIWFTDKKTGQKWHTAVCVYNNNPSAQGINNSYASFIEYTTLDSPPTLTPNSDGIDDGFYDIAFTLTNGTYNGYLAKFRYQPYYYNYANGVSFMIKDYNEKTWQKIFSESVLELGEHDFSWDGLGPDGEYLLPDGEWYLGMGIYDNVDYDMGSRSVITEEREFTFFKKPFQVEDSVVPPLPLVSAYPIPSTPGKGNEFELGIYIQHATNIKSIQFQILLPGLSDIAEWRGGKLGEFMLRDTSNRPLTTIEHEEGSDKIWVDIQRDFDGVSGEGWLAYIRLLPTASNYLDVSFENLNISYINEETMKEEYKFAFYKTTSITIEREFYNPADFNHDKRIDEDDLDILTNSLGSTRGEDRFNWRCDLDFNGIIDMNDMAIFAQALE
ncbi:MAG: S8 family serine peptidase, partial [Caldisericia bacterium]|nr:S8 family serine peptidase [Caldisericia bacterium]